MVGYKVRKKIHTSGGGGLDPGMYVFLHRFFFLTLYPLYPIYPIYKRYFMRRFVPTSQSVMSVDAERLEDGAVQGVISQNRVPIMIK